MTDEVQTPTRGVSRSVKELREREAAAPQPPALAPTRALTVETVNIPALADPAAEMLLNPTLFEQVWRYATALSQSMMVPEIFRGKPADCFVATQLALRLKCDPLTVLQNVFMVGGRPGFQVTLAIALANTRGPFQGSINYQVSGTGNPIKITRKKTIWKNNQKSRVEVAATVRDIAVEAWAIERATNRRLAVTVSMQQAIADGWTDNEKYSSIDESMLCYRAALALIRRHCPEVLFGMSSNVELEDQLNRPAVTVDMEAIPTGDTRALPRAIEIPAADAQAEAEALQDDPGQGEDSGPDAEIAPEPSPAVAAKPQEPITRAAKPAVTQETPKPKPPVQTAAEPILSPYQIALAQIDAADPTDADDYDVCQDIVRGIADLPQRNDARQRLRQKFPGFAKAPPRGGIE